ncbi:MAG: class IV adenylate cyclase [Anaerolineales bacterium]|nr:class IV adenylate cyclase [Anaerolineales bacterium]
MTKLNQELEVKFFITKPEAIIKRLETHHAECIQTRTHEFNLRFDTPDMQLTSEKRVLRLRQDTGTRLTYKGPGKTDKGVHAREEIEFTVSDYQKAKAFLFALGYQVSMSYEKYRTVYQLQGAEISLDEMPFGNFVEIEVEDPELIHSLSKLLQLNWDARILTSYSELFETVKKNLNLTFRDLTFDNFDNLSVSPQDLEIQPANS